MLLESYTKEIFRAECNPGFEALHCFANLDIEILKLLPKTNCKECGQPTFMVFVAQVAEGAKGPDDCPPLDDVNRERLSSYLGQFRFDF